MDWVPLPNRLWVWGSILSSAARSGTQPIQKTDFSAFQASQNASYWNVCCKLTFGFISSHDANSRSWIRWPAISRHPEVGLRVWGSILSSAARSGAEPIQKTDFSAFQASQNASYWNVCCKLTLGFINSRSWIRRPCDIASSRGRTISRTNAHLTLSLLAGTDQMHIIGQHAIRLTNNAEWRQLS